MFLIFIKSKYDFVFELEILVWILNIDLEISF